MTPTHARLLGMTFAELMAELDRRIVADRDPADVAVLEDISRLWRDPATFELASENVDRLLETLPPHRAQRLRHRLYDEALRKRVFVALIAKHPPADDDTPPPAFVADLAAVFDAWPAKPPTLD